MKKIAGNCMAQPQTGGSWKKSTPVLIFLRHDGTTQRNYEIRKPHHLAQTFFCGI